MKTRRENGPLAQRTEDHAAGPEEYKTKYRRNQSYMGKSRGLWDTRFSREEWRVMASGQPVQQPTRNCVACGRAIDWQANVCPYCGHDFRQVMAGPQQGTGKKAFKGSLAILIILILLCWPAAIIYFFMKRDE
jgi:predicted nucleic acid-binding Zn ribbon protein